MIFGDKPPEALGKYPGFLLNWVGHRSREAFAAGLAQLDLRLHEFAVMSMISERPGQTQQTLVDATGVDPSTMVQTIDSLENAGLAERRPHPSDRRKRAIYLTKDGEKLLSKARGTARKAGQKAFGNLTAAELAQFTALLRKAAGLDRSD